MAESWALREEWNDDTKGFQAGSIIQRTNKTYELSKASGATKASIRWVVQFIYIIGAVYRTPTKLVWKKTTNEEDAHVAVLFKHNLHPLISIFLLWAI